jgi:hypothetical protein
VPGLAEQKLTYKELSKDDREMSFEGENADKAKQGVHNHLKY